MTNVDTMAAQGPMQLIVDVDGLQPDVTPARRSSVLATLPALNSRCLAERTHYLTTRVVP